MKLALAQWTPRRVLRLWGAGLLVEAALLTLMFVLLVRPEPPLVDRLQGRDRRRGHVVVLYSDSTPLRTSPSRSTDFRQRVAEDSFYTVLHWPLHKPLLAGGGRVIAMPMRRWWVPALYVGLVPIALLAATGAWFLARPTGPRAGCPTNRCS
ncbi:MAG: hypothetical protein HOQ30_08590 [Gemmatimonadaceae bacterium]|nr:hypothetical protein [Gemmatimonadaceae bacterium]NUR34053.1 hypothetical protein [Gemmatimonadaceae bacterium]NUS48035.1 hypothetical protein [Gemmatimonadaceae bacterium]